MPRKVFFFFFFFKEGTKLKENLRNGGSMTYYFKEVLKRKEKSYIGNSKLSFSKL